MKLIAEITIPDDVLSTLVTKEWLTAELKKYLDDGGIVIPPPDPDPELPAKCKGGPEIRRITILSNQKLEVNFWGIDVTQLEYTLFKNDRTIEKGTFNPKNDKPVIDLKEKLTDGKYKLRFKGTLCTGEDTREFEFKGGTVENPINKLETTFYYSN